LSDTDQLRIIVGTAYLGGDRRGFPAASQARYGRPLARLSTLELATLVTISRAPSYFLTDSTRLAAGRDALIAKLSEAPNYL
jgi:membrane peptidoglycan carboxypeptidase